MSGPAIGRLASTCSTDGGAPVRCAAWIQRSVCLVLDRDVSEQFGVDAVHLDVATGLQRVQGRHRQTAAALGVGEFGHDRARELCGELLDAHGEHPFVPTGGHGVLRFVERHGSAGTRGFDLERRHAGQADAGQHTVGEPRWPEHRPDERRIDVVRRQVGVVEGFGDRLPPQRLDSTIGKTPEFRGSDPRDADTPISHQRPRPADPRRSPRRTTRQNRLGVHRRTRCGRAPAARRRGRRRRGRTAA